MFYKLNDDKSISPCSWKDLKEWTKQFITGSNLLHLDKLNDYTISTIWTGIDHCSGPPNRALFLFETVIFSPEHTCLYCMKHTNFEEAKSGHKNALQLVKNNYL
jgi:hypothetical protein